MTDRQRSNITIAIGVRNATLARQNELTPPASDEDVRDNRSVSDFAAFDGLNGAAFWDQDTYRVGTFSAIFGEPHEQDEHTRAWGAKLDGRDYGNWIVIDPAEGALTPKLIAEIDGLLLEQADQTVFALIRALPEWPK